MALFFNVFDLFWLPLESPAELGGPRVTQSPVPSYTQCQGWAGWGLEHSGVVAAVPAHGRGTVFDVQCPFSPNHSFHVFAVPALASPLPPVCQGPALVLQTRHCAAFLIFYCLCESWGCGR